MKSTFQNIFTQPRNIFFTVIASIGIFILLQILPVITFLKSAYHIPGLPFSRKIDIFFHYVFEPFGYVSFYQQVLVIGLSLLTAINIMLFIIFIQRQRSLFIGKSFFASISGILFGLFGVGCISCGIFILTPLLTFLGLGAFLKNTQEHSLFLSGIGIFLLVFSIGYILKKLSQPAVCR